MNLQPQMNGMNADNSQIFRVIGSLSARQVFVDPYPSWLRFFSSIGFTCVHPVHLRLPGCLGTYRIADGETLFLWGNLGGRVTTAEGGAPFKQ